MPLRCAVIVITDNLGRDIDRQRNNTACQRNCSSKIDIRGQTFDIFETRILDKVLKINNKSICWFMTIYQNVLHNFHQPCSMMWKFGLDP